MRNAERVTAPDAHSILCSGDVIHLEITFTRDRPLMVNGAEAAIARDESDTGHSWLLDGFEHKPQTFEHQALFVQNSYCKCSKPSL